MTEPTKVTVVPPSEVAAAWAEATSRVVDGWDATVVSIGAASSVSDRCFDVPAFIFQNACGAEEARACFIAVLESGELVDLLDEKRTRVPKPESCVDVVWGPFLRSSDPSRPARPLIHTLAEAQRVGNSAKKAWDVLRGTAISLAVTLDVARCVVSADDSLELRAARFCCVTDVAAQPKLPQTLGRALAKAKTRQAVWNEPIMAFIAPVFFNQANSVSFLGSAPRCWVVGEIGAKLQAALDARDVNSRRRSAPPASVMRSLRTDVDRMRKMVAAAGSSSDAAKTQQLLLEQIATAEAAIGPLQELVDRQRGNVARRREAEAREAVNDLLVQKSQAETQAAASAVRLSAEKQRAFAQAFRSAFLVEREAQSRRAQEEALAEQIRMLRDRIERQETQLVALKGERDRFQYDGLRTGKDLRKVKTQHEECLGTISRLEEALASSQEECDGLATKISLARFESTAEIHDLRAHSLNVERERDALELKCEAYKDELSELKRQLDERGRESQAEIARHLESVRLELSAERAKRLSHERRIEELEQDAADLRHRIAAERSDLAEATARVDEISTKAEDERKFLKVRYASALQRHQAERSQYMDLLREGEAFLTEVGRIEDMRLRSKPEQLSLYRGGAAAVKAWLESHGMERYASSLINAGFDDVAALAQLTEADLIDLKVLTGHRRKLLSMTKSLREELERISGATKLEPTTINAMVGKLRVWFEDFEATISIEADEAAAAS